MTALFNYAKGKIKSFVEDYVCSNQCKQIRIPDQKIILIYLDLRPAIGYPSDFIYEYKEFDYSIGTRTKLHAFEYYKHVKDKLVDEMLSRTRCRRRIPNYSDYYFGGLS